MLMSLAFNIKNREQISKHSATWAFHEYQIGRGEDRQKAAKELGEINQKERVRVTSQYKQGREKDTESKLWVGAGRGEGWRKNKSEEGGDKDR